MRPMVTLLIALLFTFALAAGPAHAAGPLAAASPAVPAGRIGGTFLQPVGAMASFTDADWDLLFDELAAIGVRDVIVQWAAYDDVAFYASSTFGQTAAPVVETVLDKAGRRGLRVRLGLAADSGFWQKIDRDPKLVEVYFRRQLLANLAAAAELAPLALKNPAFAGWYLTEEIDDKSWLDDDKRKVLAAYLRELVAGLSALAPGRDTLISGFSNGFAEPAVLARFWEGLLADTGLSGLLLQDGVGVGKLEPDEARLYFEALAPALRAKGKAFFPVVETFVQVDGPPLNDKDFRAEPASLPGLLERIAAAAPSGGQGVYAFSLPEYVSSRAGGPAAELYRAYRAALTGK